MEEKDKQKIILLMQTLSNRLNEGLNILINL